MEKVRHLADGLADLGAEITVLTSNLLDLRRRLSTRTITRRVGSADVTYLNAPLRYRWNPVCPGAVSWCRSRLKDFDFVHVLGYRDSIGVTAAYFAQKRGIPIVFEPVGMFRPSARSIHLKRGFDRALGSRLARWAALVIATSSLERAELLEEGVDALKVVVRPNGVAVEEFATLPARGRLRSTLGISEDAPVVLFLGRISRQKGLPFLVEGLAELSGAHLVVAGPDDADGGREELVEASRRFRVSERVHMTGPLDGSTRAQALADADALVLVSSGESFGNAAAEAVAAGLPVLVTDRCGVAEFIAPASLVVPYDRTAISEGLKQVLFDEDVRARMGESRPRVVQRLRWSAITSAQLDLYRAVER